MDQAFDSSQPMPAEIMAQILIHLADCRHVRMFCNDARYADVCTQHHVYRRFAQVKGWDDVHDVDAFFEWCDFYSAFVATTSSVPPDMYEERMKFVYYMQDFVESVYDRVISSAPEDYVPEDYASSFAHGILDELDSAVHFYYNVNPEPHLTITTPEAEENYFNEHGEPVEFDDFHLILVNDKSNRVLHSASTPVTETFVQGDRTQTVRNALRHVVHFLDVGGLSPEYPPLTSPLGS